MKHLALFIFLYLWYNPCYAAKPDTIQLFFDLDKDVLRPTEKALLEDLVYEDAINNKTDILIIGYADYLGSNNYNIALSERRAKSIQKHLVSLNIPANNIKLIIGKGEITRLKEKQGGYSTDRRVDIVITSKKKTIIANKSIPKSNTTNTPKPSRTNNPAPKQDIALQIKKAEVGQTIIMENLYFQLGRHYLVEGSYAVLEKLYEVLDDNPNLKIQLEGHICCMKHGFDAEDEDTRELKLSENRAKHIYEYLVKKGVEKSRIRYVGFGKSKPLVWPERSIEDQDMNRRVEIRVIEK